MNKTKKNKKGGDSDQKGNFIPYESIDEKAICPICQDPLKNEEQIIEKGIVYQLSCGHQFHNNCLKGWCKTITTNANRYLTDFLKGVKQKTTRKKRIRQRNCTLINYQTKLKMVI